MSGKELRGSGFGGILQACRAEHHWRSRGALGTFGYIWIHLDTFGYIWIHLDTFGYIWIHLDTFGYIWIHLDTFGYIWIHLDTFVIVWIHLVHLHFDAAFDAYVICTSKSSKSY